jgi:hypothetical protein
VGSRAAQTAYVANVGGFAWLVQVFRTLKLPQMTGVVGRGARRNVRPIDFPVVNTILEDFLKFFRALLGQMSENEADRIEH